MFCCGAGNLLMVSPVTRCPTMEVSDSSSGATAFTSTDSTTPLDIERHLHAPATSFRELLLAGTTFVRAANTVDTLPGKYPDHMPLRNVTFPGGPTVGDLRQLRDALIAAGWRSE